MFCTCRSATSIVRDGINVNNGEARSDFGRAFYTTPDLPYALHAAYMAFEDWGVDSDRDSDPAVVAIDVPLEDLDVAHIDLQGQTNMAKWKSLVAACRRDSMSRHPLFASYNAANYVVGPITGNASDIDAARAEPRPLISGASQYVFLPDGPGGNVRVLTAHLAAQAKVYIVRLGVNIGDWSA